MLPPLLAFQGENRADRRVGHRGDMASQGAPLSRLARCAVSRWGRQWPAPATSYWLNRNGSVYAPKN